MNDRHLVHPFGMDQVLCDPEFPWLDISGKAIPDDYLRFVSRMWDPATWERYLQSLEAPRAESIVRPREYQAAIDKFDGSIFGISQTNADDELRTSVSEILSGLTVKQRQVVEMTFWQSLSEREIAYRLGIARGTVRDIKRRVLQRLRNTGRVPPPISRIRGGEISLLHGEMGAADGKTTLELVEGEVPKAG